MNTKTWRDRLIDPRSPDRRPRRAAYALPTLFTAGNVYLGFYALLETFQGSMDMVTVGATAAHHFQTAAIAIGVAVFLAGPGGALARMTQPVRAIGRRVGSPAPSLTLRLCPAR